MDENEMLNNGVPEEYPENYEMENFDGDLGYEVSQYQTEITEPVANVSANVYEQQVQVSQSVQQVQEQPIQEPVKEEKLELPEVNPAIRKIIVKTDLLKDALSKANAAAGKNDMQPLTEVVMLRVVGNNLQVRSTNGINLLTITIPVIEATDGLVVTVKIEKFTALISKIDNNAVVIEVDDKDYAKVRTVKGEYIFEPVINLATNTKVVIPDLDKDQDGNDIAPFENATLVSRENFVIPSECANSILVKVDVKSRFYGVYYTDKIISSSGSEVYSCNSDLTQAFGEPVFLNRTTITILSSIYDGGDVYISTGMFKNTRAICIYTGNRKLFAVQNDKKDEFPLSKVQGLINAESGNSIMINKTKILGALERMVVCFDNGVNRKSVELSNDSDLYISNKVNAKEYIGSLLQGIVNVNTILDAERFSIVLKSIPSDNIIIEPVLQNGEQTNYVRISTEDRVQSYVLDMAV